MPYILDTHVHTCEISGCARISAADSPGIYKDLGYDGIVITDHYTDGFFSGFAHLPWEAQVREYLKGYEKAVASGKVHGIDVFLGMELRYADLGYEDFLVYGVTEAFLIGNPHLYALSPGEFKALASTNGLAVFQAHPFRPGLRAVSPEHLDGVEVYNGNPRHNSHNDEAEAFAVKHGLLRISGSDFHELGDEGRGGVILDSCPGDNAGVARMLRGNSVVKLLGI